MKKFIGLFFVFLLGFPGYVMGYHYPETKIMSAKESLKKKHLFAPLLKDETGVMTAGDFIAAMDQLMDYINKSVKEQARKNMVHMSSGKSGLNKYEVENIVKNKLNDYKQMDREQDQKMEDILKQINDLKGNIKDIENKLETRKTPSSKEKYNTKKLIFGTLIMFGLIAMLGNQ